MPTPSVEAVRQHEAAFPLNETGAGTWEGLRWKHGACWLVRKPMMCSPKHAPQILHLRERDGVVEMAIGWVQWVPLETMPWAEGAEWEPVDQKGHQVPGQLGGSVTPDGDPELLRSDPGANYLSLDPDDREGSAGDPEDEPEGEDPCET